MKKSVKSSIEELRREATAYRRTQGNPRCRPSERIWKKAVGLCRIQRAAVSAVAEAISVSDQGLRYRIEAALKGKKKTVPTPRAAFMEISSDALQSVAVGPLPASASAGRPIQGGASVVLPQMSSSAWAPLIELERPDGVKLRLAHLPSQDISLKGLLGQFLGEGGRA